VLLINPTYASVSIANSQHRVGFKTRQNDIAFVKSKAKGALTAQPGSIDVVSN